MSDAPSFAKFVPGFDFLQNLSKGTPASTSSASPLPGMSSWVAPTLDPEELDKRITDLKAVLFWLEQNTTALKATIQALEVQKMTLSALKNMNMDMSAMAKAFQFPDFSAATQAAKATASAPAPSSDETPEQAEATSAQSQDPAEQAAKPARSARRQAKAQTPAEKTASKSATVPLDPLQLWGSLTQQFQQIATQALQEVTKAQSSGTTPKDSEATRAAPTARKPSVAATKKVAKKSSATRAAAKKSP